MSDFSPLDPSLLPTQLPIMQNFVKKQEETDPKKFESEMKKIKTDADQKKQRKKEHEENENSKKIIEDAQELIQKRDSLYAIQKPDIKSLLKKKKTQGVDEPEKTFALPSLNKSSILFSENEFTLNLAEPPSSAIEKEKTSLTFDITEQEPVSLNSVSEEIPPELPVSSFFKEPETEVVFQVPLQEKPAPPVKIDPVEIIIDREKPSKIKPKPKPVPVEKEENPEKKLISVPLEPFFPFLLTLPSEPSNLHRLSPDIFALFERMVGVVTIMQTRPGLSQTTINLTQPQFASSIFFGCRITIEECDSAPKEFNIRLSGSEQAVKAFTAHKNELEIALTEGFENGKFHFKVHQIEADLAQE